MDWNQILIAITAIAALWAAILSSVNFITKRHQERAKVKVKLQTQMLTWGPQVGPAMVAITAYNVSKEVVFLSSFGLRLADKRTMIFPNPQSDVSFPHKLLPGTNCNVRIEYKILAQELG